MCVFLNIFVVEGFPEKTDVKDLCSCAQITLTEVNNGTSAVAKGRKNYLMYDGEFLQSTLNYPSQPLQSMATNAVSFEVLLTELGGPKDDQLAHNITAMLDEITRELVVGTVFLRHCNYTTYENQCTCLPDLDLGTGLTVAGEVVPWGSEGICLYPQNVTTVLGTEIIEMSYEEREVGGVYGLSAAAAGVGSARPSFETFTSVDASGIHTSAQKTLGPHQTNEVSFNFPADAASLDNNTHVMTVKADRLGVVTESNETNNEQTVTFQYCWPPELTFDTSCMVVGNSNNAERCISVGAQNAHCIYPSDLVQPGGEGTEAFMDIRYGISNAGTLAAHPGTCGSLDSELLVDGQHRNTYEHSNIPGKSTFWVGPVNASLGIPDEVEHQLSLGVAAEGLDTPATGLETANVSATFKFCGFFNKVEGGPGVTIGNKSVFAAWGQTVCLREEDVHVRETESGSKEVVMTMDYSERNVGLKEAKNFSNSFFLNETLLFVDADRPNLGVNVTRSRSLGNLVIPEARINEYDQLLRVHYDSIHNDLETNNTVVIKFCLEAALGLGKCACSSNITEGEGDVCSSNTTAVDIMHVSLNVTEENFPHNLTVEVEFSLAGQKIPTDEIRGFFKEDFDVRGCQVDSLTPKANSTIFTAHVTLLDDRQDVYLRVGNFTAKDSNGNWNNPSNEIYYNNPGYSAMGLTFGPWNGSEVFVPWGGTFCVTPDDEGNTHDGKRFLNVSDTEERERERERVCVCFPEYFCC